MAMMSRMWMKPPMVALVTRPNNHRTIRTTAIVYNIMLVFQFGAPCRLAQERASRQRVLG